MSQSLQLVEIHLFCVSDSVLRIRTVVHVRGRMISVTLLALRGNHECHCIEPVPRCPNVHPADSVLASGELCCSPSENTIRVDQAGSSDNLGSWYHVILWC